MLTILTALRGNRALTARLLTAIKNAGVEAQILAAVNNDDCEGAVKAAGGIAVPVALYTGEDEVQRVNHIASIYDQLIRGAETDLVVLWDDDVLPPFKGLPRLLEAQASEEARKAVGVATVYPYNHPDASDQANLFFKPFVTLGVPMSAVPDSGLHKVWGGGTGFSVWRRSYLLQTLPWRTAETDGTVHGWDIDLALKLAEKKFTTLCECSIRCRHDFLER